MKNDIGIGDRVQILHAADTGIITARSGVWVTVTWDTQRLPQRWRRQGVAATRNCWGRRSCGGAGGGDGMSKTKTHPERVDPVLARRALAEEAGDRQKAYSRYIVLHFRATGDLAPGCDNRDLQAWYEVTA